MNAFSDYPTVRAALAMVCFVLTAAPLHAQTTYTVTKTADTDDGVCDADCSLREAIAEANTGFSLSRIEFVPSLAGQRIAFAPGHGPLVIGHATSVIIDADGLDITIDARGQSRVFEGNISVSEAVFIGLTITGGKTSGGGGGVRANDVTFRRCTVTGNVAERSGGGIYGEWVYIYESTISDNVAGSVGGGVYNEGSGVMVIERSTISGNRAGFEGGGVYAGGGSGSVIEYTTITRNDSKSVGGGAYLARVSDISGSIIAGNTLDGDRTDPDADCDGAPNNSAFNVTGVGTGCGAQAATVEPEEVFTRVLDPLFAPNSGVYNSGVVRTHALLVPGGDPAANPAIDISDFGCLDGDGDGQPGCDAGAYEHRAADELPPIAVTIVPDISPIEIPSAGGAFTFTATLTNNTARARSGDVWSAAVLPSNALHQPLLGPVRVTLEPGQTISRTLVQSVPGTAPAGAYAYLGYAGNFANQSAVDRSSIGGSKVAGRQNADTAVWTVVDATTGQPVGAGAVWSEEAAEARPSVSMAPEALTLAAAYPNPFDRSTTVGFALLEATTVGLAVYDVLGRTAAVLVDGEVEAGRHEASFDAGGLAGGVYLVRLEAGGRVEARWITLLK